MKNPNLKTLIRISLLVAVEVVLSRFFSFATGTLKIGLGFAPVAVCAMLYGPVPAALAAAAADIIGALLFPIGAYFPGFTLSAALTGILFGLFLYRRAPRLHSIAAAVFTCCFGVSLLLSTLWLSIITGSPYLALLPSRLAQAFIMIPIQFIIIRLLAIPVRRYSENS